MSGRRPWVDDGNAAALTDLYELTMLQAYLEQGMHGEATFDLFMRRLPASRNYMVACGLDDVLHYLEHLRFPAATLEYLATLGTFSAAFLRWLEEFRFEGDVRAMPEGTVVFANEPILEVVAPLPQAQLIETFLLNQVGFQTAMASKAARVVEAAAGRTLVDFGMRRMHGTDATMKAARAFYIAGIDSTSNVLAGQVYGIPVTGTMAHSYIEAHDHEMDALRGYAAVYPQTVLLVDTYDTLDGVRRVVELARELGESFQVKAIRLDSGDLHELSVAARRILDEAGLQRVGILASGSLDDVLVADLLRRGAPIDGFGVGSKLGVSADAPVLDSAYKLVEYEGRGRLKLAEDKTTLPGRKQVYRIGEGTDDVHDVVALDEETHDGRPLLHPVMAGGRRLTAGRESLETIRRRARAELTALPKRLRTLEPAESAFPVRVSPALREAFDRIARQVTDPSPAPAPGAPGPFRAKP